MAKTRQRSQAPNAGGVALAESPPVVESWEPQQVSAADVGTVESVLPTYAPAPALQPELSAVADPLVDPEIQSLCANASYSLLDQRDGKWVLLVFGGVKSGGILRTFTSMLDGIQFIRINGIRCRSLTLPGGYVQ